MPRSLLALATVCVALGVASALIVIADVTFLRRQRMWIMNVVWPVTCLWSGPLGAWAYYRFGRNGSPRPHGGLPFAVQVAKGTTHCGSGCTLGDVAAAFLFLALPLAIFRHRLLGAWLYDYILALLFGVAFQYFTIQPMRHLSPGKGIVEALKADVLSLTAWQVGMYGWMAVARFALFHHELQPRHVVFWLMMQIGMLLGFVTSYPVNWWLLRTGVKDAM